MHWNQTLPATPDLGDTSIGQSDSAPRRCSQDPELLGRLAWENQAGKSSSLGLPPWSQPTEEDWMRRAKRRHRKQNKEITPSAPGPRAFAPATSALPHFPPALQAAPPPRSLSLTNLGTRSSPPTVVSHQLLPICAGFLSMSQLLTQCPARGEEPRRVLGLSRNPSALPRMDNWE